MSTTSSERAKVSKGAADGSPSLADLWTVVRVAARAFTCGDEPLAQALCEGLVVLVTGKASLASIAAKWQVDDSTLHRRVNSFRQTLGDALEREGLDHHEVIAQLSSR